MKGAALTLRGIKLSFGGVGALKNVDLDVAAGEIHAVIGPNGAGKSSLINVISGIYKPQAGQIILDGILRRRIRPEDLAALGIGRTFQNIVLFKGLSVIENVVMGMTHVTTATVWEQVAGLGRARRQEAIAHGRAEAILTQLEIFHLRHAAVDELSYGVQKRVELARVLVATPRLLLLDEPMAGMTVGEKEVMSRFIRDAHLRSGATIILIEHDMGVIMDLSDRITVLDHGKHIADGTPEAIRADQAVIDAYLGVAHDDDGDDDMGEVLAA
jgi:branched-chain amino acid transport system ATP-binding protein